MSASAAGALVGAVAGLGLALMLSGLPLRRRVPLADRVLPYLVESTPVPRRTSGAASVAGALVTPWLQRLAGVLARVAGNPADTRRRLVRAGSPAQSDEFRLEQVVWGLLAAAGVAVLGLLAAARGSITPAALLMAIGAGFAAGVVARDQRLSAAIAARQRAILAEFPAVADLLALSVAAGEGPVAALERITRTARGALPDEIRLLLGEAATGTSIVSALDHLGARTGVAAVARFTSTLAVAIERGTPLVGVLHAQAADVREAGRRQLLETGARKEVSMMIPVVFLVLPVTVVFAFFPGVVGLQLTAP